MQPQRSQVVEINIAENMAGLVSARQRLFGLDINPNLISFAIFGCTGFGTMPAYSISLTIHDQLPVASTATGVPRAIPFRYSPPSRHSREPAGVRFRAWLRLILRA